MKDATKDGFAWRRLKTLGFDGLAHAVAEGKTLSGLQLMQLVNAPIPVLAKLIELRHSAPREATLAPVVYFPLAAAVEASGAVEAAERCVEGLLSAAQNRTTAAIGIVVDRWTGDFPFETLAEAIDLTSQRLRLEAVATPFFTGPSTGELKRIMRAAVETPSASLESLLSILQQSGIRTIEGGTDLTIHKRALAAGFRSTVSQDLTRSRLTRAVLTAQPVAAQSDTSDVGMVHAPFAVGTQYIGTLHEIVACVQSYQERVCWSPAAAAPLDTAAAAESPLGAELVSAIAIARILLPPGVSIRAPLSLMGIKAAQTALHFGADDLGFAALDGATAEQLALPLYSEIAATIDLAAPATGTVRELHQENTTAAEL